MKKASALLIVFSILLTVCLYGCDVSYQGEPTTVTDVSKDATGGSAETDDSGEPATSSFFDINTQTTAGSGINPGRLTTSPAESHSDSEDEESTSKEVTSAPANSDSTTAVPASTTEKHKTEAEIMESGVYSITGRMTSQGTTIPYRIARNGDSFALVTEMQSISIGIIMTEEAMMLMNPALKNYCEIPSEMREYLEEDLTKSVTQEDREKVSEGKKEIDGVMLDYIEYNDNSFDYFYNGTLVQSESVDDEGNVSVLYIDSVSDDVSSSLFSAPSGYSLVEPNVFMQPFTQLMTTTE